MKVFLTGSTGLLGINTIAALRLHGHEVIALVRDPDKAKRVLPPDAGITQIIGDIENPAPWIERLAEADALIHTAAYFREYFGRGDHETKMRVLNVELPVALARAAERFGLQKTIMVSSSGVVEARPDGLPATERDAAQGSIPQNKYFMSKVAMETALEQLRSELRHDLMIVRPGWMFGPNDYAPTGAGELVSGLIKTGVAQLVGGTPMGVVDVRDVAEGIALCLETGKTGIYNLAGAPMPAIDALREVARHTKKGRVQQIPLPMALLLSRILEPISRQQNKANPIPRMGLLTLSNGVLISSDKAIRELGVRFRPFSETARDTVGFFQARLAGTSPL